MIKFICIPAACLICASGAAAAHIRTDGVTTLERYQAEYLDGTATMTGRGSLCVKACAGDTNPCDPAIFKRADGRCAQE